MLQHIIGDNQLVKSLEKKGLILRPRGVLRALCVLVREDEIPLWFEFSHSASQSHTAPRQSRESLMHSHHRIFCTQ